MRNRLGPQTAILDGWGRWHGAYATSYAHDSHDLIVYGADPQDMLLAVNCVLADLFRSYYNSHNFRKGSSHG
jgi:adenine deaminase